MNNSRSRDDSRRCRTFFITIEIVLAMAWCGLLGEHWLAARNIWYSAGFSNICIWTLGICIVLLLFVLPWFWAALRHVALLGWLMAAGSVLSLALLTSGHG